jgi:hypothetical protein
LRGARQRFGLSAEEATKIVKFAADSLKWLKVEE